MQTVHSLAEMTRWSGEVAGGGSSIALVPTMGYFHEGHLSLMRLARRLARRVVVSLFVNPMQFGPNEDLGSYPRDLDRDSRLAADENVDVLFVPDSSEMYPPDFNGHVRVEGITEMLCGARRPGHFEGVTTVVAKLFNIIGPHIAVFGQKDFQQLCVIRKMVRDLNWDIEIVAHPIVRESDGLAMSSRNTYLSPAERREALCLYRSIRHAAERYSGGLADAELLKSEIHDIIMAESGVTVDYISVVDKDNLADRDVIDSNSVLAMAVKVGRTRLIDNYLFGSENDANF